MSSDAIVVLKADHKEIRNLFREFQAAGDKAAKRKSMLVRVGLRGSSRYRRYPSRARAVPVVTRREGRRGCIAAQAGDDPGRHRAGHALHDGPHMVNSDRLDLVSRRNRAARACGHPLSPGHRAFPGEGEFLPVADLAIGYLGGCDAAGSSPTGVSLAIGGDCHTHFHLTRPPRPDEARAAGACGVGP